MSVVLNPPLARNVRTDRVEHQMSTVMFARQPSYVWCRVYASQPHHEAPRRLLHDDEVTNGVKGIAITPVEAFAASRDVVWQASA
jgi:hypothetical protein